MIRIKEQYINKTITYRKGSQFQKMKMLKSMESMKQGLLEEMHKGGYSYLLELDEASKPIEKVGVMKQYLHKSGTGKEKAAKWTTHLRATDQYESVAVKMTAEQIYSLTPETLSQRFPDQASKDELVKRLKTDLKNVRIGESLKGKSLDRAILKYCKKYFD